MKKLIASDLDGTILPEGGVAVNPEYYEVIRMLSAEGNVFAAASGRHFSSILSLLEPVKEEIVFLCGNGTYVSYRGKILGYEAIPDVYYEQVLADMREYGSSIMADLENEQWTESKDEAFLSMMGTGYRVNLHRTDDLMAVRSRQEQLPEDRSKGRGILKIALYLDTDAGPVAEKLHKKYGEKLNIMTAGKHWVDCVPAGADKGTALSKIQKKLGFTKADTISFGDNGNDVGMFRCSGESFCVENGRKEVKAAADHVIGKMQDDAVLSVLRSLL